jgi:hypothetical protein
MHEPSVALLFVRPLERAGFDYVITGSVAAIVYGEPRLTHDLDVVIDLREASIPKLVADFSDEAFYCPSIDVIAIEARREQRGHINILHIPTGFKADLYFRGRDPLHIWALQNSRTLPFMGEQIRVAPPEYVIVRKLEFFREGGSEKHLRDVRLMLKLSGNHIDLPRLAELISERGLNNCWSKVAQED